MVDGDGTRKQSDDEPLRGEELPTMLRGMLRYQNLLKDAARNGMQEGQFATDVTELPFLYLFAAMKNLMGVHGALTKDMLITELSYWAAAGSMPINAEAAEQLCAFVAAAFDDPLPDSAGAKAEKQYLEGLIQRFLNDRLIKPALEKTLNESSPGYTSRLDEKLSQWTKAAQSVRQIGRVAENSAVMPAFGEPIILPPAPVPTGMAWLDNYTGGVRPGDINGVLGPYSGGKTTLLAVAAVRMAQNYAARGENKLSVFIGYEDGADKTKHMFWSAAGNIERQLFLSNEKDFWTSFSDRGNLKPYDKELPQNRNGKIVLGERERWDLAMPWVNKHFVSLDFSANADNGGYGKGGAREIQAVLEQLAETRGMEIGAVCIDYAGLLVNRELAMDPRTRNTDQVWRQMQQLPDQLKTDVAVPMGATIFLAHQLAGSDIKKIPAYRYVTHLDAQGSKAFAENLHSCLCINTRDPDTKVSTINWSKIRAHVPATPFGLIKMDPAVVDIHLVNDEYTASEKSRRIVRLGEEGLVGPDPAAMLARRKHAPPAIDTFGHDI